MPKNTSMHAAGVVICRQDISDNVPLQRNGDDITTQFNMKEVESIGMLKMDFLALRTLTDIKKAKDYILESKGKNIDFNEIGYENTDAYNLIGEGDTDAVFQLESPGMKKFMRDLKPNNLEDIIAGISLYRPGPMDSIPKYIYNKTNPDKITYKDKLLEPILKVTHGTIIYQEQVMQIVQQLAGFSLGQADIVRRAMSKKNSDEMARQKTKFIFGCHENGENIEGAIFRGVSETAAAEIFDEMESFAKYAFNKSHAAAYAVVAYQTAYLKKFYPNEFLAAVLNNRIDDIEEITKYVMYLREKNIKIEPPDINNSKTYFTVENKGVRFGLVALKGVGINAINTIIEERNKNGNYKNFEDFLLRCPAGVLNKRAVESLILAGAFDNFKIYRSQLMRVYEELLDRVNIISKKKETNQMSIFGELIKDDNTIQAIYPDIEEFPSKERLSKEKAVLGLYVTGHPLESYKGIFESFNFSNKFFQYYETDEEENKIYTAVENEQQVELCGIISSFSRITTKGGKNMAFLNVEDIYGFVECVVFPNVYEKVKRIIKDDSIIKVSGKLQIRLGEQPKIIVDNLIDFEHIINNNNQDKKIVNEVKGTLWLNASNIEFEIIEKEITEILSAHRGNTPVKVVKGKDKYNVDCMVNYSNALINELKGFLTEKDIKFIEK
jgi:DNA polymerase-3 subunit alpha